MLGFQHAYPEPHGHYGGLAPQGGYTTLHGTKFALHIAEDGFLRPGTNQIGNMHGIYHAEDVRTAAQYSGVFEMGGMRYRAIYELHVHCANSCGGRRSWQYTKASCCNRSITITAIYIAPEAALIGIRCLT